MRLLKKLFLSALLLLGLSAALNAAVPNAPASMLATARIYGGFVDVSWDGASAYNGVDIGAYFLEVDTGSGFQQIEVIDSDDDGGSFSVACGVNASIRVRAQDADGNFGPYSTPLTASIPCAPSISSAVVSSGQLTLNWLTPTAQPQTLSNAYVAATNVAGLSDAQYITVFSGGAPTGSRPFIPNPYETWRYRVYEVDSTGAVSAPSAEIVVMPPPTISATRPKSGAVYLSWQSIQSAITPNVIGYALYYAVSPSSASLVSPVALVPEPGIGNFAAITLTAGIVDGQDYNFAIASYGGLGSPTQQGMLNPLTYTVRASYPNPVIKSFKQPQGGPVSLAWNPADLSGASLLGYTVYRSTDPSLAPRYAAITTSASVTSALISQTGTAGTPDYYYVVATDTASAYSSVTPTQNVLQVLNVNSPILQTPVIGNARVLLSWASVTGTAQYQVYRSPYNSPAFLDLSSSALSDGLTTGLNYTDSNPINGQPNYYMAVARQILPMTGSYAESSPSASVTALPVVLPGMPGYNSSTRTSAVSYYLTVTALTLSNQTGQSQVALSWAKAQAGSLVVTGYQAYQGPIGSEAPLGVSFTTTPLTAFPLVVTATTLDAGGTYTFSVEAIDSNNNVSQRLTRTVSLINPNPPTLTNAYSMSPTAGKATLVWTAPVSQPNPLMGYTIFASSSPNAFGSIPIASGITGTSFVDSEPSTVYVQYYRIFSNDNLGLTSTAYAAAGVTLNAAPALGGAPSAVASVTAMSLTGSAVLVQWAPNLPGENVTGYNVYRNGGVVALTTTSQLQYTDSWAYSSLVNVTYTVAAFNGTLGPLSAPFGFANLPPAPTGIHLVVDSTGATTSGLTLAWNSLGLSGNDGYVLYRSTGAFTSVASSLAFGAITSTSVSDYSAVPGTAYEYRVASYDSATPLTGPVSLLGQNITANNTPAAPTGFAALTLSAGGAISLSWTSATGNVKFWVFRNTVASLGPTPSQTYKIGEVAASLAGAANTFVDVSAQAGTGYYYAVAALDYNGRGTAANLIPTLVTPTAGTPYNLTAVATASGSIAAVTLTWTVSVSTYAQSTYDVIGAISPTFSSPITLATGLTISNPPQTVVYTNITGTVNTPLYYRVQPTGASNYAQVGIIAYGKPSVVSGLTATAAAGAVNLVWAQAPASEGVTAYQLYYATNGLPLGLTTTVGLNTSFVVAGVSPTTGVTATVQAINSWGLSDPQPTPVYAISNLAAGAMVPLSFTVSAGFEEVTPTASHLNLSWVGAGVVNVFEVYRSGTPIAVAQAAGGALSKLWQQAVPGSVSTVADTAVTAGTPYYYALTAVSPTGLPGGESYPVFFGPVTPFNYPSLVSYTAAVGGNNRADLVWSVPVDSGTYGLASVPYTIYRNATALSATASNAYTDSTVSNGSSYTYSVSVTDAQGHEQPNPNSVTINPMGQVPPPSQLRFIAGDKQVTVEWLAQQVINTNSTYNVYRRDNGALTYNALPLLREVGPSSYNSGTLVVETLVDSTAVDKNTYCYTMAVVNSAGEGPKSAEFCVTPFAPLDPTASPIVTLMVVNRKDVQLSWNACAPGLTATSYALVSYRIYRSNNGGSTFVKITADVVPSLLTAPASFTDTTTQFGYTYVYRVVPVDAAGNEGISYRVAIVSIPAPIDNVLIFRNSFNPAKGETVPIQYVLLNPGHASVKIYTLQGEYVATLFEEDLPSNTSADNPYLSDKKTWDGHNSGGQVVASGVYLVHLESNGFKSNGRVAVIK